MCVLYLKRYNKCIVKRFGVGNFIYQCDVAIIVTYTFLMAPSVQCAKGITFIMYMSVRVV